MIRLSYMFQYRDNEMLENHIYFFYVNAGPYAAFALNIQTRPTLVKMPADSKKT